jgi:hypothetical protein
MVAFQRDGGALKAANPAENRMENLLRGTLTPKMPGYKTTLKMSLSSPNGVGKCQKKLSYFVKSRF